MIPMERVRRARIRRAPDGRPDKVTVEAYLPFCYDIEGFSDEYVYIVGTDVAGWTLEDYVIPRLASGLIWCEEYRGQWHDFKNQEATS